MENYLLFNLIDPVTRGLMRNRCFLRSYQAEALRTIYDAAVFERGGRFTVTFPRQSGKNETQAQLEAALMAANTHRGGSIIKILPTEKNQGGISLERLSRVLRGMAGAGKRSGYLKVKKDEIRCGSTKMRCLSASPNASIVGATADLLLEVDEAQLVPAEKFDREAAPMAAASNAVQVFWGTVWDDRTLLARESRLASLDGEKEGTKHTFSVTAAEVGKEVPEYGEFVRAQVERLGREHPAVRTQFFCEEISDLTAMFTPERIQKIRGMHEPLFGPLQDQCYVFLIDIAGSDEITAAEKRANGFSDRRDATVLTICEVHLPEDKPYDPRNFVWKAVARRLYRNVPSEMLEKAICTEVDRWDPRKIILDHSGLGSMLCGLLSARYPHKCRPVDITPANKTKMAWDFLAMVCSGRWQEYRHDELRIPQTGFKPGRDRFEILRDPTLLQILFFTELRACKLEPAGNGMTVRWGVKDGTRDPASGRLIHDDLVMSAALCVFEEGDLPIGRTIPEWVEPAVFAPMKW